MEAGSVGVWVVLTVAGARDFSFAQPAHSSKTAARIRLIMDRIFRDFIGIPHAFLFAVEQATISSTVG